MSNPAILIVEDEDRTGMAEVQDGWRLRMIQSQGFVLGIADRSGHRKDKGYGYYGWPNYWGGPYMLGVYPDIA